MFVIFNLPVADPVPGPGRLSRDLHALAAGADCIIAEDHPLAALLRNL